MQTQLAPTFLAVKSTLHPLTEQFFADARVRFGSLDHTTQDIVERLESFCLDSGKQVRPLLALCGWSMAAGQSLEAGLTVAPLQRLMVAIQLTHQRILMADDVADRDELRYGQPTVHARWESDIYHQPPYQGLPDDELRHIARTYTEIAGIWLQSAIQSWLAETPLTPAKRREVERLWLQYMYEHTCAGWFIHQEQNREVLSHTTSEARFLRGLEMVTADYTCVGPLLMGATLAGGRKKLMDTLKVFGAALGMLFQLSDDRLGIFGETEKTGKPSGNDVREGKKTLYLQYAFRSGTSEQQRLLADLTGKADISSGELEKVRHIIHETGAYEHVEATIRDWEQKTLSTLAKLPAGATRDLLEALTQFLVVREK